MIDVERVKFKCAIHKQLLEIGIDGISKCKPTALLITVFHIQLRSGFREKLSEESSFSRKFLGKVSQLKVFFGFAPTRKTLLSAVYKQPLVRHTPYIFTLESFVQNALLLIDFLLLAGTDRRIFW